MQYGNKVEDLLEQIIELGKDEEKQTGFCIGNTAKIDKNGLYFTPVRSTEVMVLGGVIVYSEKQAIDIAKAVDGKVDYILVDAEKKIPDKMSLTGEPANVERSVRETIRKSTLWIYKGNDLAVEAIDGLLTHLTKNSLSGIGGMKIAILGAGNLGCKLALNLVERGAHVFITKRDSQKLNLIVDALNYIKPVFTKAQVVGMTDNDEAAKGANILIGMTQGTPIITPEMIENLSPGALVVDGGKGTLSPAAIKMAESREIPVFRLDVGAALEGKINSLFATEDNVAKRMGRCLFNDLPIVSGGLMGRSGEIVVDNINNPRIIYGIADGKGDFLRDLSPEHLLNIRKVRETIRGKAVSSTRKTS
ncbi:MAG: NAD(P)-binding domain-containing protein [Candidatus Margulisiibacteriota bacterium]